MDLNRQTHPHTHTHIPTHTQQSPCDSLASVFHLTTQPFPPGRESWCQFKRNRNKMPLTVTHQNFMHLIYENNFISWTPPQEMCWLICFHLTFAHSFLSQFSQIILIIQWYIKSLWKAYRSQTSRFNNKRSHYTDLKSYFLANKYHCQKKWSR